MLSLGVIAERLTYRTFLVEASEKRVLFSYRKEGEKEMNQEDSHTRIPLPSEKVRLVLLASASAQPFAEMFWETTKSDSKIAVLLLNLFSHLQEEKGYDRMFEVLRILHGAFRVRFGPELLALQNDPAALACFLDCFLRDFYEIIDDHVAGIG